MIPKILRFLGKKQASIKTVYIVFNQDDARDTFQHVLQSFRDNDVHAERSIKVKPSYNKPSTAGVYTLDSITINIIQGDITDESSDAVVNSTSEGMKLVETGVCGALLRKAGPGLQSDCDAYIAQHRGLKYGDVATTPARGSLKCKTIFHVNYDPKSRLLPETVSACLTKADELGYSTISFPALGTGNHKCSPEDVAIMMREGIKHFDTGTRKLCQLKTVRIVILQPDIYQSFIDTFDQLRPRSKLFLQSFRRKKSHHHKEHFNKHIKESDSVKTIDQLETNSITASVYLNIFGDNNESVRAAGIKLHHIIDMNCESSVQVIPYDLINDIPKSDLETLIKFSEENGVELSIDRAPLNQIRLYGDTQTFSKVQSHVLSFLSCHQSRVQMLEKAKMLQMGVEWQRRHSDGTYHPYETLLNYKIENEYKLNSKEYIHTTDKQENFRIDFKQNVETDVLGNVTTEVRRVDKSSEGKIIRVKCSLCKIHVCAIYTYFNYLGTSYA